MRNLILILLIIVGVTPMSAQNLSNLIAVENAPDEIYVPEGYLPPQPIERTSFQKGIGVSTDVVAVALPVAAIVGTLANGDWEGMKQIGFTAALAGGLNLVMKYTVRELRPDHSNYHSFPSMHSTVGFASAAYLQRRYGWKFGGPAYALATYVACGRVMAKKHHWWDCVVGAAIGAGSAYLFTTPWAKKHEFSLLPVADETQIGLITSIAF